MLFSRVFHLSDNLEYFWSHFFFKFFLSTLTLNSTAHKTLNSIWFNSDAKDPWRYLDVPIEFEVHTSRHLGPMRFITSYGSIFQSWYSLVVWQCHLSCYVMSLCCLCLRPHSGVNFKWYLCVDFKWFVCSRFQVIRV